MANLYTDNFTASSGTTLATHTSDSGATYENNTGFVIRDNHLVCENATDITCEILGVTGIPATAAHYTITLNYKRLTDINNMGLIFCSDATAQNAAYIRIRDGRRLQLYYINAGTFELKHTYTMTSEESLNPVVTVEVAQGVHIKYSYGGSLKHTQPWATYLDHDGSLFYRATSAFTSTTGYHIDSVSLDTVVDIALSNPSIDSITTTTAQASVDTDTGEGTLYAYAYNYLTGTPDAATIKTGSSQAVTTTGTQNITVGGIEPGVINRVAFIQTVDGSDSNIVYSVEEQAPIEVYSYGNGTYPISATATAIDTSTDTDTGTLTVTATVEGSISATTEDSTLSASSSVINYGSISFTIEDSDWTGGGSVRVSGSVATTTEDAVYTGSGAVPIAGTIGFTTDDFTWRGSFIPAENRGSINAIAYYLMSTGEYQSDQVNDIIKEWLLQEGYSGSLNNMFYSFLGDSGYSGTLQDRLIKWSRDS